MSELIFEEPSGSGFGPSGKASRDTANWLERLTNHPGVWARYPERVPTSRAIGIKRGQYGGFMPGMFEVTCRDVFGDPVRCDMYVRYVGKTKVQDGVDD